MPDIRNFFGAKGSQGTFSSQEKPIPFIADNTGSLKRKRTNVRKVIDDSEDEDYQESTKKTTPKKPTPQKRLKKESPKEEETTTVDYFQSTSKSKPASSAPPKSPQSAKKTRKAATTNKSARQKSPAPAEEDVKPNPPATNGRATTRRKKATSYVELHENEDAAFLADDKDAGDDIHTAEFKGRGKKGDDEYKEEEDEEDEAFDPPPVSPKKPKQEPLGRDQMKLSPQDTDVEMQDVGVNAQAQVDDSGKGKAARKQVNDRRRSTTKAATKQASPDAQESEEGEAKSVIPGKKKPSTAQRVAKGSSPKKTRTPTKKAEVAESKEMQAIFDSIPTVQLPTPDCQPAEPRKFNFQAHSQHSAPPPGAGSKALPAGAENCLAGLSFVFTGVLETLGRDEGHELVKRYGGRVTTAPSAKTSYVVLGNDAGPKKIETIRKNNIPTIDEDGLFELVRRLPANGGDSKAAAKHEEQKHKEEQKVKEMAAEMEREEKRQRNAATAKGSVASKSTTANSGSSVDDQLWTVKYAPNAMNQICGNKGQVEKLQRWLREWPKSQRISFKKAGPDGSFCYRAVIIHGPPGIGKTTAAHLVAKMEGYDVLESNASDTRSKKLVETGLRGILDNTSLLGYFAADNKKVEANKKKLVLIMDEVDGMSAGDRGGVGALAQVCKKTNIPMILICNERRLPKMKPFDFVTYDLAFRRPTVNDIRSRIASICFRESLKLPTQVIDALIEGSHADIRQIINMISTAKLDQEAMSFDDSKSMSKAWEKHVILKPWDIAHKLLSSAMFGATSNKSLNDKIELYFNDHEFSYLMLQENYLKTTPSIAGRYQGKERTIKCLELVDQAAESISDGDLVDRMIHGPQQQWSLMPTHAVFSTVRPASFIYGNLGGQVSFTSWLGNNSKQGKLSRFVKEIQGHMRLRASGDRHETRQQYLPALWSKLIRRLQVEGRDAVPAVIELMDSYFLTKDDFDAIIELGLGPMDMENVKIEPQTKATFTRLYNQQSHPLPFIKPSTIGVPKKAAREKPDLEEAIEESDEGEDVAGEQDTIKKEEDEELDLDLSKDKYVKQPKKKKAASKKAPPAAFSPGTAGATGAAAKGKKGKKKKVVDENDDEDEAKGLEDSEEEDVKPATKRRGPKKGKAPPSPSNGRGKVRK